LNQNLKKPYLPFNPWLEHVTKKGKEGKFFFVDYDKGKGNYFWKGKKFDDVVFKSVLGKTNTTDDKNKKQKIALPSESEETIKPQLMQQDQEFPAFYDPNKKIRSKKIT